MNPPPALLVASITWIGALSVGVAAPSALAQEPSAEAKQAPTPPSSQPGEEDVLGPGKGLELTLTAAIEIALKNNLGLKIEQLSTEVAYYDTRGTWGAFDWRLAATAAVQDREFKSTSVFGGSKENTQSASLELTRPLETGGTFLAHFDTANTTTNSTFAAEGTSTTDLISLEYKQPLLRGAWREYATAQQRSADLTWKQQSEHERQLRHRLIQDVANAYWDLVLAREQLEVARSSLGLAQAQLDQDRKRVDAGVGIPLDVFAAEAEVANNEERVLQAELRVRQTADVLKVQLFPGTEPVIWDTMLVPSTPLADDVSAEGTPTWNEAFQVALDKRAELRQQHLSIELAALQHELRENERQGALDLDLLAGGTGFDGDAGEAFKSAGTLEFPTYRAALSFTIPLQNRTARFALKAAWANLRAARLAFDQLETQVASEVREAVRQVRYQAEAVRAAKKSLDLAQRQLSAEQSRREGGVSTNFEVLRLQRDLATALSNERTTRVNFAKALVGLRAAQGLLAEAPTP